MKKFILVFALALLFVSNTTNAAIESCGPNHAVYGYEESSKVITSCIPEADWERTKQETRGNQVFNLIKVAKGQSIMTTSGYVDTCPIWYFWGCEIRQNLFSYFIK